MVRDERRIDDHTDSRAFPAFQAPTQGIHPVQGALRRGLASALGSDHHDPAPCAPQVLDADISQAMAAGRARTQTGTDIVAE